MTRVRVFYGRHPNVEVLDREDMAVGGQGVGADKRNSTSSALNSANRSLKSWFIGLEFGCQGQAEQSQFPNRVHPLFGRCVVQILLIGNRVFSQ